MLTVSPAPVLLALQSNLDWLLAGQELSVVAIASTTATSNGIPLTPDGAVTFYDNGAMLVSQPLAVVAGQDQAVLDTTTLAPGRHVITVGYTSASGNFAMTSASPVLTEIDFPGRCDGSDGGQYEQRPDGRGKSSLGGCPGRCEQCRYGDHLRNGRRPGLRYAANDYP